MIDDKLLLQVEKPGRYVGNEIHMVKKEPAGLTRFALCFPDVYEVGMSHLGLQILYFFLNRRDDVYCERAFMPWQDMAGLLRAGGQPLFALETGDALRDFSFIGFTLQYELCYTNVLAMLELAGLPLRAAERGDDAPIVCAGGPNACNPEPMADFIDFFYIGDGEASLDDVMDIYREVFAEKGKRGFLAEIAKLPGIYVPAFYEPRYNEDGTLAAFDSVRESAPAVVKKALAKNLDETYFPQKTLIPLIETTHHRAALELFRGCKRGCRFCQAGMIQRPLRYRKTETLLSQAEAILDSTGHEEISLMSLSTSDYPNFHELLDGLLAITAKRQVNISLPSLRLDATSLEAMRKTQEVRRSSLTFAPEAGTQRLRDVINKDITDADIAEGCRAAFEAGFDRIKLYFMSGLPTETEADTAGIAELAEAVVDEYYTLPREKRRRAVTVSISCSCFVPKPFTPFQWESQDTPETFVEKQRLIKSKIKKKQVSYRYHDAPTAMIEGVLARGDRRVAAVIEKAYRLGAVFDGWTEFFRAELWREAFAECGIDPDFYTRRKRPLDELLPWDFIDMGISKEFLQSERGRAYEQGL